MSGGEGGMVQYMEFWLACRFGRVWLRLRKGLRPDMQGPADLCAAAARGQPLPARELGEAQNFAVLVWWRAGMAIILWIFPIIAVGAILRPGQVGRDIGAALAGVPVFLTAMAMAQMGFIRYRSDRNRLYVRKAGHGAGDVPLPPGSPGLPRRRDFWVMLAVTLVVFAALLTAGLSAATR